jgi:hypothetical protein
MPNETDIYRSAKIMIDQYGDRAEMEAKARSRWFGSRGDAEGSAVWERIRATVFDLQRTERPEDTISH